MHAALLVDDEVIASLRLARMLEAHPEVGVIGTARNVAEAREFVARNSPEIVFLDMEMPGERGIDLLPDLPECTHVVFATAHPEYALTAFEVGAVDYLLKPIDPDRLETAVERVLRLLGGRSDPMDVEADADRDQLAGEGQGEALWMPAQGRRERRRIATRDVLWVESMGNYTRVGLVGRPRPVVFRLPISRWSSQLSKDVFVRLDRSLIVQLGALRSTKWRSRNETLLTFEGGRDPLVVGRTAAARLRTLLAG
jgi:two-component system LytT family response regulator